MTTSFEQVEVTDVRTASVTFMHPVLMGPKFLMHEQAEAIASRLGTVPDAVGIIIHRDGHQTIQTRIMMQAVGQLRCALLCYTEADCVHVLLAIKYGGTWELVQREVVLAPGGTSLFSYPELMQFLAALGG